jgi:hypothetical protein
MRPKAPGATPTADPRPPDQFPFSGNYGPYLLFGSCGAFLLLSSLIVVEFVLALLGLVWFTLRFLGLFPKTQPFRFGPLKRPPVPLMLAGLYGAFVALNLVVAVILGGVLG